MLLFVLRKMAANRWMVASLLIGVILAVAMVSTIPIYSRGVLTRLLLRDLQTYQEQWGRYPGYFEVTGNIRIDPAIDEQLNVIDEFSDGVVREVNRGLPVAQLTQSRRITHNYVRALRTDQPEADHVNTSVTATSGLFERVRVVAGRLPVVTDDPGVFEAVITELTAASGTFVFMNEYGLISPRDDTPLGITMKVVGVVSVADPSDVFWSIPLRRYKGSLLVCESDVRTAIQGLPYTRDVELSWVHTFDYQAMDSDDASRLVSFAHEQTIAGRSLGLGVKLPILPILKDYEVRERLLKTTLWVLQVPLLLMLAFYLFMVSQVLIDHERNEIALMKSRGSDNLQVFITYVLLGLLLSLAAVAVGPFLGMAICRILGASSGFLEFVQRKRLRLELTSQTYLYAVLAAGAALLAMLIPALQASRTTIVLYKQRRARTTRRPIWKLLFFDVIAIAVSIYGLYRFRARGEIVRLSGLDAAEIAIDPMLFFVSTLFVIGAGLLFLRLYPLLVRLVFRLGERRWAPTAFSSLVQVGRGGGKDQFLMLFIILSISVGVFNADAARTLNQNVEDQIRYGLGAPVVVQEEWIQVDEGGSAVSDRPSFDPAGPPAGSGGESRYVEPEFRRFQELEAAQIATKVFTRDRVQGRFIGGDSFGGVTLMGIIPHEFGRVAWFRSGLLPSHWYNYLNLLGESPAAALVSTSLKDAGVELGDPIYLQWPGQPSTLFYVYGFVDFWPTFNPYERPQPLRADRLAVVNLTYLQAMTSREPYEVWLLPAPGATSRDLYDEIDASNIQVTKLTDASQELISARKDPLLQGTNGTLSLGFLVSLGVCFVGFLIYWIFAIRERTLQFGLFRAMGMTKSGIVRMLAIEQILISGVAVGAGFGIGRLTSQLFAPLLQVGKNAVDTVPPYQVISLIQDQARIGGFVVVMLILGFVVLASFLARIRIHQAVKLGEE